MRLKSKKGFALIILAVILSVAGVLMITLMTSPPDKELRETVKTKNKKIDKIHDALIVYYNQSSALPKPASLTATASSGTSYLTAASTCAAAGMATRAALLPDGCMTTASTIMIGAVPTRTLGLPDDAAFDEWGNRLIYAVDTSSGTGITLNTTAPAAVAAIVNIDNTTGTAGAVTAVIVSAGKNGNGAYTKAGLLYKSCATSTTTDGENCNGNATFIMDNKTVVSNATTYDDFASYLAVSGCSDTNRCYAGIKLGGDAASMYTFRFNKDGKLKILNKTSPSPWTTYWPNAGNSQAAAVNCQYITDGTGYTGCVMAGYNLPGQGEIMAFKIDPKDVVNGYKSGTLTAPATNSVSTPYYALSCGAIQSTQSSICIANNDGGGGTTNYDIFRVDYSTTPVTITMLKKSAYSQVGLYPTYGRSSCAKEKRSAGPISAPSLSLGVGGTLPAGTYYVKTTYTINGQESFPSPEVAYITDGNALVINAPAANASASGWTVYVGTVSGILYRQGSLNLMATGTYTISTPITVVTPVPDEALCTIYSSAGGYLITLRIENVTSGGAVGSGPGSAIITPWNTSNKTSPFPVSAGASAGGMANVGSPWISNLDCYGMTGKVLCVAEFGYYYGAAFSTYTFGVYRWVPNASSGVNGAGDFTLIDAAYYNGTQKSEAYYYTAPIECFESTTQTDKFSCVLHFRDDTKFNLFSLQDCTLGTLNATTGPSPSCFIGTGTATFAGVNGGAAVRTFSMAASTDGGLPSYTGGTVPPSNSKGYIVTCSGLTNATTKNRFCLATTGAATPYFHLWQLQESDPIENSTFVHSSIESTPPSYPICDTTGTYPCNIVAGPPYYQWGAPYNNTMHIYYPDHDISIGK